MINTIFYFADTVQDYQREKNGQGISDKTITFIKETGDIYLDGVNYGRHPVEEIVNSPEIQEVLGNIDIEARAGNQISVPGYPTVTSTRSGNKTILTFNNLKGEKGDPGQPGGNGIDGHSPRVEIREVGGEYYWFIDGVNTGVKARGENGHDAQIDDSWIDTLNDLEDQVQQAQTIANQAKQDAIDKANAAREAALAALRESEQNLNAQIALLTGAEDWGDEQYTAIYNEIKDKIAQDIAAALKDRNGRDIWTRIGINDDSIFAITTKLNSLVDENGNATEALQTIVNQSITNILDLDGNPIDVAISELSNKWALLDENENILKWMASGITAETMRNKTFMQMIASAGSGSGGDGIDSDYVDGAIAGLRNEITETLNGYVAEATLTAKIFNALGVLSSSQIALKTDVNGAVTTITNRYDGRIAGIESSVSKLSAMTGLLASYNDETNAASITLTSDTAKALIDQIVLYDSAKAVIRAISTTNEAGVDIDTLIQEAVDGKFATTNFATKSYVDELNGNRLTAETAILTAIKNANGDLISSADILAIATLNQSDISALTTTVNGHTSTMAGFVTRTELNSAMSSITASYLKNGNETVSSADVITTANNNSSSITALSTRVGTLEETANTLATSIAGLATKTALGEAEASLTAKVNKAQADADTANAWISTNSAGLVTSANIDSAVATLFAENSNASSKDKVNALIQVKVSDGISNATIQANKIQLDGLTSFINSIEGIVYNTEINGNMIKTGVIAAEHLDGNNLHVKAANIDGTITAAQVQTKSGNTITNALNSDGSGLIANGNVSWNTNGVLTLSDPFLQALVEKLRNNKNIQDAIQGWDVNCVMRGIQIPTTVTYLNKERLLITSDASSIMYFDPSTTGVSATGQYPVGGTLSDKKTWLANNIVGYSLKFKDGLLQGKLEVDIYTNKEFVNLTANDLDSRVTKVTKYSDAQLASSVGLSAASFKGVVNTRPTTGYNSGDWVLYSNDSGDALYFKYMAMQFNGTIWQRVNSEYTYSLYDFSYLD